MRSLRRLSSALALFLIALVAIASFAVAAEPPYSRSALFGVWEVVACKSDLPRQPGQPVRIPNYKYCFNASEAYPELSPDEVTDSADGSGEYWLVGGNVLVLRTGVPGGVHAYAIVSISRKQIIWFDKGFSVTLRRVARTWSRHAPKLQRRDVPISYRGR